MASETNYQSLTGRQEILTARFFQIKNGIVLLLIDPREGEEPAVYRLTFNEPGDSLAAKVILRDDDEIAVGVDMHGEVEKGRAFKAR